MTTGTARASLTTIGLFGGTFDPIHMGHLRIALELKYHLELDQMRLLPCHIPPHRQTTVASADQRAKMLALALEHCDELMMDDIELHNPEPSYSVHTLMALRKKLGEKVSLCLAMGMDSLVNIQSWYRWDEMLQLAHIIVAGRPGWTLPERGELAHYLAEHRGQRADLKSTTRGKIVVQELTLLPISSTQIRTQIARGESVQFLLPDAVWQFLNTNNIYATKVDNHQ